MPPFLRANAAYDWQALKAIWSDDPTNVFFNMNGHAYVGLEHWSRLIPRPTNRGIQTPVCPD